jgi:hypothetical protein
MLPSGHTVRFRVYCNRCATGQVTVPSDARMVGDVPCVKLVSPPGWLRLSRAVDLCPRCAAPFYLVAGIR